MNKKALDHFKKVDPVLYKAAKELNLEMRHRRYPEEYLQALCSEIVGQQLSGRVADVIWGRFIELFPNKKPTPELILQFEEEKIRAVGMSFAKIRSLKDLSQKVLDQELHLEKLNEMTNEEVIAELVRVRGIGPWTAEMFLMFTLGREDIFSHGDLGLRNGIKKLYNLEDPTRDAIEELQARWSPYRTYACLVLWKSLDNFNPPKG